MKIFDILPENFFSPLSSSKKQVYADCIFIIFKQVSTNLSFGVEREIIIETLTDYFEGLEDKSIFSDEDETIKDSREEAGFILRRLEECGWIHIETTNSYVRIVNFHDYAVSVIQTLEKLLNNERLEYQGYIYTIYSILFNEEKSLTSVELKQIYDNTNMLISGLKTLNSNIKKYMENLTKHKTTEEIMKALFQDYKSNVIDKAYHRLKTSDNVSKFRPRIIERLEMLVGDSNFVELSSKELLDMEEAMSLEEGKEKIMELLSSVIYAFNNMDDIINDIDRKNTQYIKASLTRAKFLLNTSKDLSGQIKFILKYLTNCIKGDDLDIKEDTLEEIGDLFSLFPQSFIDENSLYAANEGKKSFTPQSLDESSISMEERKEKLELIKEKNKNRLSRENVNSFVKQCLGDNKVIKASNLPLNEVRDFMKLIYIRIYAKSKLVDYYVKKLDNVIDTNGYSFRDFEIWRKQPYG